MIKHYIYSILIVGLCFSSCDKQETFEVEGPLPGKPSFSITPVEGDPNSYVVEDLTTSSLSRTWEFAGGIPETSNKQSDTVFYNRKGVYDITLHITDLGGNGNSFNTQQVDVENDVLGCQLEFLTEDCGIQCYRLSGEPSGVLVGPTPFSGEWFTSPDITETQADDVWCFNEDGTYSYDNNGSSFSACQGFVEDPDYPIPADVTYVYNPGAGLAGSNSLLLNGIWFGIEDTGPTYDIVEIDDDKMIIVTPIAPCDGTPSPGFFTLTFFKVQ